MTNTNRFNITDVTAKAAFEAGIRSDEFYTVSVISNEGGLLEFVLTTEWNTTLCYADLVTGEIVGLLSEAKAIEDVFSDLSFETASVRRAA